MATVAHGQAHRSCGSLPGREGGFPALAWPPFLRRLTAEAACPGAAAPFPQPVEPRLGSWSPSQARALRVCMYQPVSGGLRVSPESSGAATPSGEQQPSVLSGSESLTPARTPGSS